MKTSLRFVLLLALIALLMTGPALPALAQDGNTLNCNGLNEADCALLSRATAAMGTGITSFTLPAWSLKYNMDAGPTNSISFDISGSGTVVLPGALLALTSDLPAMITPTDLTPVIELLQKMNSTLVEQAIAQTGLEISIDRMALSAPGQTLSGSADVIMKDGSLYIRLEAPNGAEAWFGDQLELNDSDREDLTQSINDLLTQLQSEEFQQALAQASELQGAYLELYTLLSQYVITTRGADVEAMGQTMAVFTTTFDMPGMLNDPDLPAAVMTILKNPALTELGVDSEVLQNLNETQVKFVLMTAGLLIGDSTYTMEQWIGVDDSYLHKYAVSMAMNLDTTLFGDEVDFDTLTLSAEFGMEIDQINTASMEGVTLPPTYHDLDDTDNFLVGSPDMIEADLRIGQTFSGSFTGENDQQDVYSLSLEPGQTVSVELKSDDYPYLKIYGPDGFLIGDYDTYSDHTQTLTAEQGGVHLLNVEAYWNMKYDLTVRPQ